MIRCAARSAAVSGLESDLRLDLEGVFVHGQDRRGRLAGDGDDRFAQVRGDQAHAGMLMPAPQPLAGDEQRRQRTAFGKIIAQHQLVQRIELPRHHFQFLGFIAGQALRIKIARQHQPRLVAHVGGRQAQRAQHLEPVRAVAGFFLQFAIGGLHRGFAGIDAALDQAQFVTVHARRVFAHQQHGFVVQHRHHHHRAMAVSASAGGNAGARRC